MPKIGKPPSLTKFPRKVTIRNNNIGEKLNKIAGNKYKQGINFVDASTKTKLGKDGFMKILAHQLKNQDPTNPMDQKQMTADLAQMSQLEQMTKMNANIAKLNPSNLTKDRFYAASFLGKEVLTAGTTIKFDGNKSMDIPFTLPVPGKKVVIRVMDDKGQLIKQIDKENLSKGSHLITWDGKKMDGYHANKGLYNISVIAQDDSFKTFKGETMSKGIVTDVRFKGGETVLKIDGTKQVFLRDVENFSLPGHNKTQEPKVEPTAKN